jgi:hypothetical protein
VNNTTCNDPVVLTHARALLLIGDEEDPNDLVGQLTAALVPASYVVISHAGWTWSIPAWSR